MERSPPKEAGEAPKPRRQVLPPVRPSRLEESEATRGNVLINYCLNRSSGWFEDIFAPSRQDRQKKLKQEDLQGG